MIMNILPLRKCCQLLTNDDHEFQKWYSIWSDLLWSWLLNDDLQPRILNKFVSITLLAWMLLKEKMNRD